MAEILQDFPLLSFSMDSLPGAPFSEDELEVALAAARSLAGWHIAPVRVESVVVDVHPGDRWLRLPTMRLRSVESITDLDTGAAIPAASYRVSESLGQVKRSSAWPSGYARVSVSFTHGFDDLPADLLPSLADAINLVRRDSSIRSAQVDDAQVTFGATVAVLSNPLGGASSLDRYSLYGPRSTFSVGIA